LKLNYIKLGRGRPLLILHGLFGSLDNWKTLGNKFAEEFEVYLIDLRNHGKSPHSDEFNYQLIADDLTEFIEDHYLRGIYAIGHSMGGKALMSLSQHCDLLDKIVIADIAPKAYSLHHGDLISIMEKVDLSKIKNRNEIDQILQKDIPNLSIRQFLMKNLYWKAKDQLDWKINLPVIKKNMHLISGEIDDQKVEIPTLFIRGELSNYILDDDIPKIQMQFPNSTFETIPKAGHWLHAENPILFYNLVIAFFKT
jgi:esterase